LKKYFEKLLKILQKLFKTNFKNKKNGLKKIKKKKCDS